MFGLYVFLMIHCALLVINMIPVYFNDQKNDNIGCKTYLAGVVGNDYHCVIFKDLLKKLNISPNGLITGRNKTTAKLRGLVVINRL